MLCSRPFEPNYSFWSQEYSFTHIQSKGLHAIGNRILGNMITQQSLCLKVDCVMYGWKEMRGPAIGVPYEKDKESLLENALLIPMIALGYVPFVFFWLILISSGSDPFAGYYLFIYSGMCLVILLPFYSIYLVFLTWQRYRNGTLTLFVSIIHILSFIIPLLYFLMFATFSGSPAWLIGYLSAFSVPTVPTGISRKGFAWVSGKEV